MKKINFTSATATKLDDLYFTLELFNGDKLVYSSTIDLDDFIKLSRKHNIKVIL